MGLWLREFVKVTGIVCLVSCAAAVLVALFFSGHWIAALFVFALTTGAIVATANVIIEGQE